MDVLFIGHVLYRGVDWLFIDDGDDDLSLVRAWLTSSSFHHQSSFFSPAWCSRSTLYDTTLLPIPLLEGG